MNSKQYIPNVFHGKWRFPEKDEFKRQFCEYQECMGTLYYDENKPIKLEIYHAPTQGIIANMYFQYDVIWGRDANGYEFTLFNVSIDNPMQEDCVADFSKMEFNVDYVILGRHVQSMDEPIFDICTVKFPYLKNWAFQDNREEERNGKLISCTLDLRKGDPFLETEIEDGIKIALVPYSEYIPARYDTTVAQNTYLRVSANKPIPTNRLMQLVFEFSQFLSIALFSNQSPCKIELRIRQEPRRWAFLLYEMEPSTTPYKVPLVKYDRLADKVPFYTTDRTGSVGYVSGDYMPNFNGTSSACPHVAGVAALILSVNPNLTQKEVATIIEKTARKVGGYSYSTVSGRPNGTWHTEVGYGLIDAYAAVMEAQNASTTVYFNDKTVTTNTVVSGSEISATNVTVKNNAKLTFTNAKSIIITQPFTVELTSSLELSLQ